MSSMAHQKQHKFTYTISGVDLSDEQRALISREIGSAVTRALIGDAPNLFQSDLLTIWMRNGGRLITAALAAKSTVPELIAPDSTEVAR